MLKKSNKTIIIVTTLLAVATALIYFLMFDDLFINNIRWVSMCVLLIVEILWAVKAVLKKDTIMSNALVVTNVFFILFAIFIAILYNRFWNDDIKRYLLWNAIALLIMAIIDVIIVGIDKRVASSNAELSASKEAIYNCAEVAMTILAEHPDTEFEAEIREIVDMLRYSDDSSTTGEELKIYEKLKVLKANVANDSESVKDDIKEIKSLIINRTNKVKSIKRGSF